MRILTLFVFCWSIQAADIPACEPRPEVKQALASLKEPGDGDPYVETRRQFLADLDRLLKQYPGDFFIHRKRTSYLRGGSPSANRGMLEYKTMFDQSPDDPLRKYYYARTLFGTNTPEETRLLESVMAQAPDFVWPHLDLAEIRQAANFRDKQKQLQHLEAFFNRCPGVIESYFWHSRLDRSAFTEKAARHLRSLLPGRTDPEAIRAYSWLWTMEFKDVPSAQQEPLRARVQEDMNRLASLDPANLTSTRRTFVNGYKLIGKTDEAKEVEDQIEKAMNAQPAWAVAMNEFYKTHPTLKADDPAEKRTAHYRDVLAAAGEWIQKWPRESFGYTSRLYALKNLDDATPEQVEKAGDALLTLELDLDFSRPPTELNVAQVFAHRGVRLDRVPGLVAAGLKRISAPGWPRLVFDLYPQDNRGRESDVTMSKWAARGALADLYMKTGDQQKLQETLREMSIALEQDKPGEKGTRGDEFRYREYQRTYWEKMAEAARAAKHPVDALAYYQRALASGNAGASVVKARELWKELGGSNEAWQAFTTVPSASTTAAKPLAGPAWSARVEPFPAFEATDLAGRKWTLADVKGKVTLVNVWATWCVACVNELPHLEKLQERLKQRGDAQVISLNIDDNPGLVQPFLKDKAYTFPVLMAQGFIEKVMPSVSIPRTWIIDSAGVMQQEQTGFGPSEKWLDAMVEAIDKVAKK